MKVEDRNQLAVAAASKIHEAWCEGELRAFYARFKADYDKGVDIGQALLNACIKNGVKRNEVDLDTAWLQFHEFTVSEALKTFEGFKALFERGIITVKRFTRRELTKEEQKNAGLSNYNPETKEENILRPFVKLSADSQRENLEAAKGAVNVYEEYAKRGVSIAELSKPKAQHAIGTVIHADWMMRNEKTDSNSYLFTSYKDLDDWTKQQDLDLFSAVIAEIKKDEAKYAVAQEEGLPAIDPEEIERNALDAKAAESSSGLVD